MLLIRAAERLKGPLWHVANLESTLLSKRLESIPLNRPVYICGLARSGSTMLLELFSQCKQVATHRYRDFPFIAVPCFWNWFLDRCRKPSQSPYERPHADGIYITAESPEAMDEPLWRKYAADVPLWNSSYDQRTGAHRFHRFYADHLRKILLTRGASRFVGKNNYHVARIAPLANWLDAHFVIPVRHPIEHVTSLMRQHQLFSAYNREDQRVAEYLTAACHFEFGPQRKAFCSEVAQVVEVERLWHAGQDAAGYAVLWSSVYDHVFKLLQSPSLAPRIHLVKYEDFCEQPTVHWRELCSALELSQCGSATLDHVRPQRTERSSPIEEQALIWSHTAEVAAKFGYQFSN